MRQVLLAHNFVGGVDVLLTTEVSRTSGHDVSNLDLVLKLSSYEFAF